MVKNAYTHGQKCLYPWSKMPIPMVKNAYTHVKKCLFPWSKMPIPMVKNAYLTPGQRGLLNP